MYGRSPYRPQEKPTMRRGLGKARPLTLPQNLLTAPGTIWEDFETVGDWTAASGVVAANAAEFKTGAKSVKLTANAGASATMVKTVNWDLSTNWGRMLFWYYMHDALASYGGSTIISLSNDAAFTNYFRVWLSTVNMKATGWSTMTAGKTDFGQVGAPSWSNPIVRVRFQVVGAAGQTPSISFDSLYFGLQSLPAAMLIFDDGYASQYATCYAYMKAAGIPGTLALETDLVGVGGKVTLAQVKEMDAAGWTIANHTNASLALAGQAEAAQETQISGGKTALNGWGLTKGVNYVVYPSGTSDANTLTAMTNLAMLIGRNTTHPSTPLGEVMLALPFGQMTQLPSYGVVDTTPLATATGLVDKAIANGYVAPFHFHDVGAAGEWTAATFRQFVDYLASKKSQITPITLDHFYKVSQGAVRIKGRR
jgi:peptidoglycan/xylan/chitin deacetylase (PgdA/CDA1 family)